LKINSLVGEMAQLKQADEDLGSPRALELEQLKTDFGKKQAELQRSNQHLAEMREEVQRRERMAELERRRMEEELRERDELLKGCWSIGVWENGIGRSKGISLYTVKYYIIHLLLQN
jgi:hypothetical protein